MAETEFHQTQLASIGAKFQIAGTFERAVVIPSGHINTTFATTYGDAHGQSRRYLMQSINRHVFSDPIAVMRNIEFVTQHLKTTFPDQINLSLVPSIDGAFWASGDDQSVWRCYDFIENCVAHDAVTHADQAYQAAIGFGNFQTQLSSLDPNILLETIPDFHHTPKRLQRLIAAAKADHAGRRGSVLDEINAITSREKLAHVLIDGMQNGHLPLRITHNDTKINNVMMSAATGHAVCVIDLDTVMPGLTLFDFGDLVRSAANQAAEDERYLSRIEFSKPFYQAIHAGFMESAGSVLTEHEVKLLPISAMVITLEVAMRFLTDFLEGDVYFKTHREGQNLDRCRAQLKLLESMEQALRC